MRTRGHHRTSTVAIAGLAMLAIGAGAPAMAADQPAPGEGAPTTSTTGSQGTSGGTPQFKPESKPAPKPEPVRDVTAPQRPTLGEASVEPGGAISLDVLAESGSALVVREGAKVVASASATGLSQTLSWRTTSGPHTYLVVATDAAGNVSDASPITLEVDATAPAAEKFNVQAGTSRDSRSSWSVVTEPGTAYTLLVDGKTASEGVTDGRRIAEELILGDGRHDVRLELRDRVGNLRTLTDTVAVDIPTLWVAAKDVSEPNSAERTIKIAAPPATRGFLRIPGGATERFELPEGRAEVTVEVPEGSYGAPIVIVADTLDRKGSLELDPFTVDLTAPVLEVTEIEAHAERGVLSAAITAGEGDTVAWRLLANGVVVLSGEFVADGTEQLLQREVAEGSYELEVTATDPNGNVSVESVETAIAAKPIVNPDVVPALVATLVLWVLVGLSLVLRRRGVRFGSLVAKVLRRSNSRSAVLADYRRAVAAHEQELELFEQEQQAWEQRRSALAQLIDVAQGAQVEVPESLLALHADERVYGVLPASLLEVRELEAGPVPVEVEKGHVVVTATRIAFAGAQERDWELAKVEQVRHLGEDRTLLKVSDRRDVSGLSYADADLVRLYLELAMGEHNGTGRSVVAMLKQGMRQHELRRPQAPSPVGPAPLTGRAARKARKADKADKAHKASDQGVAAIGSVEETVVVEAPVAAQPLEQTVPAQKQADGRELVAVES